MSKPRGVLVGDHGGEDVLLIPEVAQTSAFSCGAAALLAVLEYWGASKPNEREEALRGALSTTKEYGTDAREMERLARARGLEAHLDHGLDYDMLRSMVREGWTIITEIQAWDGPKVREGPGAERDAGHYVVVMGCDGERVFVMDPALRDGDSKAGPTQYGWVPAEEFERAWLDDIGRHGVGVVIQGKFGARGARGPVPANLARTQTGREQPLVSERYAGYETMDEYPLLAGPYAEDAHARQVPMRIAERIEALRERTGPDGWVDMIWRPDNPRRHAVRKLIEACGDAPGRGPTCARCGQWYVGDKAHDCRPDVALTVHFSMADFGRAEKVRDSLGLGFDSGAGGGTRDWQFEMLDARDRQRIVDAMLAADIPFAVRFQHNKHLASCEWDGTPTARAASFRPTKPPGSTIEATNPNSTPAGKRALKLTKIAQKADDQTGREDDRHTTTLQKIDQAEQDATRNAFIREGRPQGFLINKKES